MSVAKVVLLASAVVMALCVSVAGQGTAKTDDDRALTGQLQRDAYAALIRADMARDEKHSEEAIELYVATMDLWAELGKKHPEIHNGDAERYVVYCKNEIGALLETGDLKKRYGDKLKSRLQDASLVRPTNLAVQPVSGEGEGQVVTNNPAAEAMHKELERLRSEISEATRREAVRARKKVDPSADALDAVKARQEAEEARKLTDAVKRDLASALAADKAAKKQLETVIRQCEYLQKEKLDLEKNLAKLGDSKQSVQDEKAVREATEELLEKIDRENKSLALEKKDLEKRMKKLERNLAEAKSDDKKKSKATPAVADAPATNHTSTVDAKRLSGTLSKQNDTEGDLKVASDLKTASAVSEEVSRLMREKHGEKAYELVMFGLAKSPEDPQLLLLLGTLQVQAGRCKDAISTIMPLVEADSSNAKARVLLGASYCGLGRYDEARMELEAAIGYDPDLSEAHYNFAQLLLNTQPPDPARALEQYKSALALGAEPDPVLQAALDKATAAATQK